MDVVPRNKLRAIGVHNEFYAATLKVIIYFLIMDHLTQQKNSFVRILLKGLVTYFNCIFDTVAETKVPRKVELDRPEIEHCGREVLLSQIFRAAHFFYFAGNG